MSLFLHLVLNFKFTIYFIHLRSALFFDNPASRHFDTSNLLSSNYTASRSKPSPLTYNSICHHNGPNRERGRGCKTTSKEMDGIRQQGDIAPQIDTRSVGLPKKQAARGGGRGKTINPWKRMELGCSEKEKMCEKSY